MTLKLIMHPFTPKQFIILTKRNYKLIKTILQTPTGKLKESLAFYQKLHFTSISNENPQLFSDGKVLIEVNDESHARAGLKLFKASWKAEIQELKKHVHVSLNGNEYLFADRSGLWIYLIEAARSY
jgi:hypothetical protein